MDEEIIITASRALLEKLERDLARPDALSVSLTHGEALFVVACLNSLMEESCGCGYAR